MQPRAINQNREAMARKTSSSRLVATAALSGEAAGLIECEIIDIDRLMIMRGSPEQQQSYLHWESRAFRFFLTTHRH